MKLSGVRVLDLSLFLPGPHLAMTMADHGAEVIKVEPHPHGDPARAAPYRTHGHSVWFRNTNRGKKSLRLNLKDERGREILLRLCERSDVFLESFRPGVMKRLGVDYEAVSARAPQIVYCSITAFGQSGRYSDRPAHDPAIQAMAGIVSVNLGPDGRPAMPGLAAADAVGSLVALSGILMALLRRRDTGRGDYLDVAMHDALQSWTAHVVGPVFAEHRDPIPQEERSWGGAAFNHAYETLDGRFVMLGGVEVHFARNLLTKAGRPDLVAACEQPAGPAQEPVKAFLREMFRSRTLADWQAWLADIDVAWAPVRSLTESLFDPATAARGMLLQDEAGDRHLGTPIRFRHEPARPSLACPALGQDADEILRSLGYADTEIDALRQQGVI